MSKPKFKIGDSVKVVKVTGSGAKARYIGSTFEIGRDYGDHYRYSSGNTSEDGHGWCYSEEELELVKDTYTGIELLQAIKDGVFKDGDEFYMSLRDIFQFKAFVGIVGRCSKTLFTVEEDGEKNELNLRDMLNRNFIFSPIVKEKEPINLATEDKKVNIALPVEILNKRELIDVEVTIKGNKIIVRLPSEIKGVAKCCPEDKFDQTKGVRLAFTRAIKKQIIKDLDKVIAELVK